MATPCRTGSRSRGHTLIEALVTLTILALLGSIALPSLGARAERARLSGAAEQLAADLADARFEAARRGTSLHLVALAGERWCWSVAVAPGCACGQPQPCQLKSVGTDDHAGVRLATPFSIRVDPGGEFAGDAAVLESHRGDRLRVGLAPSGRARICAEPAAGGGNAAATLPLRYPRC